MWKRVFAIGLSSLVIFSLLLTDSQAKYQNKMQISALKKEIVKLAEQYKGNVDLDGSRQKKLELLVNKLVEVSSPPPVAKRLAILDGGWKQIWGPYNYRDRRKTIDPSIDIDNIYQVVSKDGYYYNVTPNPSKDALKISLLRGIFKLNDEKNDTLNVSFTKLNKLEGCPKAGLDYLDLARASEKGTLANEKTSVPSIIVKLFFDKGELKEVYTDRDLRITFGTGGYSVNKSIYVMKRVTKAPILQCETSK